MCLGCYTVKKEKPAPTSLLKQDKTKEMKEFICRKCGIYHAAICEKCRIHSITKIEVKD